MTAIRKSDLENLSDEDLYLHFEILVDKKQTPIRIDKFLMDRLEKVSRNRVQTAINMELIVVNEKPIKSNYKVKPLDVIKVVLPGNPADEFPLEPEDIPLDIVYEDESVLVVNKQAELVVHPGTGNYTGTLVNALLFHLMGTNMPVMEGNPVQRPGLVHRIDKDTSGLMVIAKTEEAMTHLAKQFFDHTIKREYLALVWGDVEADRGTIEANIGRHPTDRMQMYAYEEGEEGKRAVTHYEVIERMYYVTLVKCHLETGRTHQIRVHMKYLGHTLFNDERYGGDRALKGTIFTKYKQFVDNCFQVLPRQALHAKSLGFVHPDTGKDMFFEADPPADFVAVLEKWRHYHEHKVKSS